jgi:hypothetical protein
VMGQRPVEAHTLPSAASMVVGPLGAVTRQQGLRVPPGLQDGFVPRSPARRVTVPPLSLVEALQRLVRTPDEAGDRPADMVTALRATKAVAKPRHPSGDRLWALGDRQPVRLRYVDALISPRCPGLPGISRGRAGPGDNPPSTLLLRLC